VLGLADRVLVMREGTVAGELRAQGATEEDVLHLASGTDGGAPSAAHSETDGGAPSAAHSKTDGGAPSAAQSETDGGAPSAGPAE
jgi:ABC-type uncharacterized transport system ATPase subunit